MNITFNDLFKFYNDNADFKSYVDKCIKTYGGDIPYVLAQPITKEYYCYLNKIGDYDEHKDKGI